jgi:hypothetical protein
LSLAIFDEAAIGHGVREDDERGVSCSQVCRPMASFHAIGSSNLANSLASVESNYNAIGFFLQLLVIASFVFRDSSSLPE